MTYLSKQHITEILINRGGNAASINLLKEVLSISGYDLRSTPLVNSYLAITDGINEEIIRKANDICKEKLNKTKEQRLPFGYFRKVLENLINRENKPHEIIQWGRMV